MIHYGYISVMYFLYTDDGIFGKLEVVWEVRPSLERAWGALIFSRNDMVLVKQ